MSKKKEFRQTGVYMIKNNINNKVYIGQTMVSFQERWTNHKRELNRGTHRNCHLQRSWDKYGETCFDFSILEVCKTLDECNISEEKLIKQYKSLSIEHGYNLKPGGNNHKIAEETRQKMIDSWTEDRRKYHNHLELHQLTHSRYEIGDEYKEILCEDTDCNMDQYREWEDNGYSVLRLVNTGYGGSALAQVKSYTNYA